MLPGAHRHEPDPRPQAALDAALALINARRREWVPQASSDRPATLIGPMLPAGTSNHSFLVQAGEEILVLRLDGIDPARNAIDRQAECTVQAAAAAAGLAPRPRFCSARAGVLLVDYLSPDVPSPPHTAADIGRLLRRVHRLDVDAPSLCLGSRLRHYENLVRLSDSTAVCELVDTLSGPLQNACHRLDADSGTRVLCHNDLTPDNRLTHRGSLFAIDWEYAAHGNRWFDLAVAAGSGLPASKILEGYLQRLPTRAESGCLMTAKLISRYLELLWIRCNTDVRTQTLLEELNRLRHRVDAWARDHAHHVR